MSEPHHRRHRSSSGHRRRHRRREEDGDDDADGDHGPRAGDGPPEGLVKQTKACDEQWYINMVEYLGPVTTEDRALCWLCRAARHDSALIPMAAFNDMAEIFKKGQLETDPVVNAWNLSAHFEVKIRQVANSHLRKRQTPIPELKAVDIYWHFRMHIFEASNEVFNTIQDIKAYERDLLGSCRKAIIKADGTHSFAVRKKYTEHLNKVWTQKRLWLMMRPERSAFYNPVYGLNVSDVAVFANKNRYYVQANVEDYLAKESAKRVRVDPSVGHTKSRVR